MPKITNEAKMDVLKAFLQENNITFEENFYHKWSGEVLPLYVPQHRIGVRIGDDDEWYQRSKGKFYPIFIRTEDTKAKVLEKIQNTIIKSMTTHQKALNRIAKEAANGKG